MNLQHSEKLAVTPQDDPDQSLYICQGIRTERPSYSFTSDSLKTKNLRESNRSLKVMFFSLQISSLIFMVCFHSEFVVLKRRVLLSISGFIFFGIIAVFLGCIVLRVMRKPGLTFYIKAALMSTVTIMYHIVNENYEWSESAENHACVIISISSQNNKLIKK